MGCCDRKKEKKTNHHFEGVPCLREASEVRLYLPLTGDAAGTANSILMLSFFSF